MLFDCAQIKFGQSVLIHGAAGNVGAYAVRLAAENPYAQNAIVRKEKLSVNY